MPTINTAEIEARWNDDDPYTMQLMPAKARLEDIDDILAALKAETARTDRYAERLEITHVFEVGDSGEFVRVEIPREDWDKQIDGIECREQTIKEQDRENEELQSQLTVVNEKLAAYAKAENDEISRLKDEYGELDALMNDYKQWYEDANDRIAELNGTVRRQEHLLTAANEKLAAAREALRPFAKIFVPIAARDGDWVARTIYCNDQITAIQVQRAKEAMND